MSLTLAPPMWDSNTQSTHHARPTRYRWWRPAKNTVFRSDFATCVLAQGLLAGLIEWYF